MLDPDDVGRCIRFGVAVIALLLAFRYLLRPTLVETFRQRVFALRRELFMLRVDGVILPTDPSYQLLMRTLNGVIQFAESLTLGRVLFVFSGPGARIDGTGDQLDPLDLALQRAPERQRLEKIRLRLGYEMARHVAQSSLLGWLCVFVTTPIFHLFTAVQSTSDYFSRIVKAVGVRPSVKRMECAASAMLSDEPADNHGHAAA